MQIFRLRAFVIVGVVGVAASLGCGVLPLKDPFRGLSPGACAQDSDCAIAACPNACNQGKPWCTYPQVLATRDIVAACPCFNTPGSSACAAPSGEACGPQPGCAQPADEDQVRARCVAGTCAARFSDGGVVR